MVVVIQCKDQVGLVTAITRVIAGQRLNIVSMRENVDKLGGLEASNSYVRFYLAMSGLIDWSYAPAIPPELMLLPNWFPVNLYEMSSWTRGIVVPLTLIYARKPAWKMPEDSKLRFTSSVCFIRPFHPARCAAAQHCSTKSRELLLAKM